MNHKLTRRTFIESTVALGGVAALKPAWSAQSQNRDAQRSKPIGEGKGIHPGRVVWAHDPQATVWNGPGNGRWYEGDRTRQDRVDAMMARAVSTLAGSDRVDDAWDRLFRFMNRCRGKGDVGYRPGERVLIKPNFVGLIWRMSAVNPENYSLESGHDYMNTAPQVILALVKQLVRSAGVRESDITLCDTLACLVDEYFGPLQARFPKVQYADHFGKFGRIQAKPSDVPIYWSSRPQDVAPDYIPDCFAAADYLINLANLKAHTGAGVTLCAKNHFGSLVRWPAQPGYYNMHRQSFARTVGEYREQVDLMGHAHLGGKTVLYLVDGLYAGVHPVDSAPRKWTSAPFHGHWTSSVFASQDPVAIDSVCLDFLQAEWEDHPRRLGVDDYLHEAALAASPPSATFYDPNHETPTERLGSLGVHEHWTSATEKQYSRNLGEAEGIELVQLPAAS